MVTVSYVPSSCTLDVMSGLFFNTYLMYIYVMMTGKDVPLTVTGSPLRETSLVVK